MIVEKQMDCRLAELAFVDKLHPSRFPIGRSPKVLGLETVVGTQ
jgi:hypothetical protein